MTETGCVGLIGTGVTELPQACGGLSSLGVSDDTLSELLKWNVFFIGSNAAVKSPRITLLTQRMGFVMSHDLELTMVRI